MFGSRKNADEQTRSQKLEVREGPQASQISLKPFELDPVVPGVEDSDVVRFNADVI